MKRPFALLVFFFAATALAAESKYALLIANSKYQNFSSLDGPVKEARDLSLALKSLGFTVDLLENGTREQMLDGLDTIKQRIDGKGGIALFHFGGHGVQALGKNYLIPVDADIPDEKKLSTRAVDVDEVMSSLDLSGSDANIVILDACRNNPLPAGSGRSASRGLTVVGLKPKNSIIVYSAEAGTVAQDGLFTPTLTRLIMQSDKSLSQILMQLRREVSQKTNNAQIPGEYNQLFYDIYFAGNPNPGNTLDAVQLNASFFANKVWYINHTGNLKYVLFNDDGTFSSSVSSEGFKYSDKWYIQNDVLIIDYGSGHVCTMSLDTFKDNRIQGTFVTPGSGSIKIEMVFVR